MKAPQRKAFHESIVSLSIDQLHGLQVSLGRDISSLNAQVCLVKSKMDIIKHQMDNLKGQGHLGISDHAVVRYMERRMGVDIQAVRKEIVALGRNRKYIESSDGHYDIGDGMTMVIPQGSIVATILTPLP